MSPASPNFDIEHATRLFLDAYLRNDQAVVLACVNNQSVIYGSDVSEVISGPDQLRSMMVMDAALWGDGATIGEMRDVSVVESDQFKSIFFQAEFTLAQGSSFPVRFCIVWKAIGHRWIIAQSSNAVVTTGYSAGEILSRQAE